MARRHALRLGRAALAHRDPVRLDLAADLVVPPLSQLAAQCCAGALAAALLRSQGAPGWSLWAWAPCLPMLAAYVARGWALSGTGARGLFALACAPFFAAWKYFALLSRPFAAPVEWVRTPREPPAR